VKDRWRLQALGTVGIYLAFMGKFGTITAGKELPVATAGKCHQRE
jgi:hypothetical protein